MSFPLLDRLKIENTLDLKNITNFSNVFHLYFIPLIWGESITVIDTLILQFLSHRYRHLSLGRLNKLQEKGIELKNRLKVYPFIYVYTNQSHSTVSKAYYALRTRVTKCLVYHNRECIHENIPFYNNKMNAVMTIWINGIDQNKRHTEIYWMESGSAPSKNSPWALASVEGWVFKVIKIVSTPDPGLYQLGDRRTNQ